MDTFELVQKKFEAMGARVKISNTFDEWRRPTGFQINVGIDRKGEFFELSLGENPIELIVVDCQPRDRHLLLLVKIAETTQALTNRTNWHKLLCGHDERHWFVAGIDPVAANVARAKDMLKPPEVVDSEVRNKVGTRDRDRRKNAAFIRQGEWFFVPVSKPNVNEDLILLKEPLIRGFGSKPHMVDQIYRRGGVTVYVCRFYPDGLTERQYRELLLEGPKAKKLPWQVMAREPEVFARGRVRHPDHKTVVLNGWHRAYISNEDPITGAIMIAFLD